MVSTSEIEPIKVVAQARIVKMATYARHSKKAPSEDGLCRKVAAIATKGAKDHNTTGKDASTKKRRPDLHEANRTAGHFYFDQAPSSPKEKCRACFYLLPLSGSKGSKHILEPACSRRDGHSGKPCTALDEAHTV